MVASLNVKCQRSPRVPRGSDGELINQFVTSGDLVWVPQEKQLTVFADRQPAAPNKVGPTPPSYLTQYHLIVAQDILLAKLCPGQEIEMEVHAIKGLG